MDKRTGRAGAADLQLGQPRGVRSLWLVSLALLLSSCSAQWHLKRAIAKDPTIVQDTIVQWDTTIVNEGEVLRDTIVMQRIDTIKVVKDGVRVELRRFYDTVEVDVECPTDTITITKEVPIEQKVVVEETKGVGLGAVLGIVLVLVVMKLTANIAKKIE